MTTVSIPLAIWGTGYVEFLPRWLEGVESLQRKPDQVLIVTDSKNYAQVKDNVGDRAIAIHQYDGTGYADYWNKAISLTNCDWIGLCNGDDKFLPQALNDIDLADSEGCNLITDKIQDLHDGAIQNSSWNGADVGHTWTMVGCEPIRKDLFDKAGGFDEDQRFADWALAMKIYQHGVKAFDSDIVRIIYDRGVNRKTISSVLNGPTELQRGYHSLASLSKRLGFER
jgi:hypothetical protein